MFQRAHAGENAVPPSIFSTAPVVKLDASLAK
jgi:hypothetical protein